MIEIQLTQTPPEYRPGEIISGRVDWLDLDKQITSLETRLIWYTQGKGDQDVGVAISIPAKLTAPTGNLPFEFSAPPRPFSFSGKLISLIWAVEVVLFPSQAGEREQITISGSGQEVVLDKSLNDAAISPSLSVK
jgi:hypothetical protein